MTFTNVGEQQTWDRLLAIAAGSLSSEQALEREVARMKRSPVAGDHTLQDALDVLAQAEKSKRIFGQNLHAAMRTAYNLWPNLPAVGKTLRMEAQLQVDRGKLSL